MKLSLKSVAMIVCLALWIGCRSKSPTAPLVPMVYSLTLSEDQVAQLTVKAEQGDKEAAFTLYQYFAMVKLDKETSLKWMTLAAHGGHSVAQYNLGMVYSGEIDPEAKDTQKAIYWFRRCAESGDEQALQKLEQLETDVKN